MAPPRAPCTSNSTGPRPALSGEGHLCSDDSRAHRAGQGLGERPFPTTAGLWCIYDSGSGTHKPPLSPGRMTMHLLRRGLCWSLWQTLVKAESHQTRKFQQFYWSSRRGKGCNQERRLEWKPVLTWVGPGGGCTGLSASVPSRVPAALGAGGWSREPG